MSVQAALLWPSAERRPPRPQQQPPPSLGASSGRPGADVQRTQAHAAHGTMHLAAIHTCGTVPARAVLSTPRAATLRTGAAGPGSNFAWSHEPTPPTHQIGWMGATQTHLEGPDWCGALPMRRTRRALSRRLHAGPPQHAIAAPCRRGRPVPGHHSTAQHPRSTNLAQRRACTPPPESCSEQKRSYLWAYELGSQRRGQAAA